MLKSIARDAWLPVLLAGIFIALDLLADRLTGGTRGFDLSHLLLGAAILLISSFLLNRAVANHRRAEAILIQTRSELEEQVRKRTMELEEANRALRLARTQAETEKFHLEAVFQALPIGIVITDEQGGVILSNGMDEQIWGPRPVTHSVDDYRQYRAWWADSGRPVEPREWASAQAVQTGKSVFGQVLEIQRFDGKRGFILNSAVPVRNKEGRIIGSAVAIQDVTELRLAERALRESEEKYRLLFQNMAEGFALYELLYDAEGQPVDWRILEVNDAYTRHTSVPREQIVGRRVSELFPEAIPEYLPLFARVVATQVPSRLETYAKAVGRYQSVSTFPAGGHRFANIIEDITARKQMEEALRQSEERFRLALKNAPVTVAAQDKNLRFIWAYGQRSVRPEDVIGKTDADLFPPDTAARLVALKREVLETGAKVQEQMWVVSGNHRLFLEIYLEPIRNEQGEIVGVGIATVDLTGRKHTENALRASEDKFATVFRFSPSAIGIVRAADGVFLDVNDAFTETLGYARSAIIGKTWPELQPELPMDGSARAAELFREAGGVSDLELDVRTRSGEMITVLLSLIPIAISGEPCILAIAHDITRRKQSEEALRQAQAKLALDAQERSTLEERQRLARELHDSVSQALYGVSLGINTALTLFDTDRAKARQALDYALSLTHAGLTEMRALIFELRPESLELEGLVAALTKQAEALRARHGIDVGLSLEGEPDAPLAVKETLYRIAQEALQNAVRHARATRLDVRLARDPQGLRLEVCDNGVGFDPAAAYPGHLGLSSMRERAAKAGGTLDIISAPDHGTAIRVALPMPITSTPPAQL